MKVDKYDAIVVGAGPAGSSFAYYAAKKGLKVLIVEKQREVAHTILCAEGVSSEFLRLVNRDSEFTRNYVATYIYGGILTYNGKPYVEARLSEPGGAILERKIFDRYLAERALRKGADILVNTKFVSAERNGNVIKVLLKHGGEDKVFLTPLVVDASGPTASVAKSLGLYEDYDKDTTFYTYQVYAYCDGIKENYLYFGIGEEVAPKGYAWIFPKGQGFANIGVGIPGKGDNLDRYLDNFLEKHCKSIKILGVTHGVVPTGFHRRKLYGDNILILGDAARLADPLTGGGIANAYISGMVAAEAAFLAKEENDFSSFRLKLYDRALKKWLMHDYMITLFAKLFYVSLSREELEHFVESIGESLGIMEITPPINPVAMLMKVLKRDPLFLFKFGRKGIYAAKETLRQFI